MFSRKPEGRKSKRSELLSLLQPAGGTSSGKREHTQRPPPRASPVSLRGREARAVRVPRCAHARLRDARARAGAVNFAHSFVYSATQLLVWWLRSFISFLSIERKFT